MWYKQEKLYDIYVICTYYIIFSTINYTIYNYINPFVKSNTRVCDKLLQPSLCMEYSGNISSRFPSISEASKILGNLEKMFSRYW